MMKMMMISVSSSLNSPVSFTQRTPSRQSIKNWKKLKKTFGNQAVNINSRRGRGGICRAELAQDVPFAAAIGACVLTSLLSPISHTDSLGGDDDGNSRGAIDSTDARYAVMGIISFIPYFNWMSWVFAWLDSGEQRYLVYAVVYLAPYLRTNLSLSPEESWLPIASIVLCIIHVQLEASMRNGDLNGIQFFGKAVNLFSPSIGSEDDKFESDQKVSNKIKNRKLADLHSTEEDLRDELGDWGTPRKHMHDPHRVKEYSDVDETENRTD
ncbi:uncharacterized protein A4U43_C10F9240 [Asparagus officinalis]|uniref:Uncharacterized protein n=1 Tax=Asparagus officinalis TaxID=4686 RepID=A0A5P1E4W0_ASPOF|nr:uncharacterized protein LOC109825412 [Asparagus officinalis]ONK56485.1 uncharacterized protein A4U43_C10F9240 [Asparagus officinalis]